MRIPRSARRHGVDAGIVLLAMIALVLALLADSDGPATRYAATLVPLVLLARLRFPLGAPIATLWATLVLDSLDVDPFVDTDFAGILFWVSLLLLASGTRGRSALVGWVLLVATIGVQMAVAPVPGDGPGQLAWLSAITGLVFLGARVIRRQREQAALLRRQLHSEARLAAADERVRIARELHDVVAHSLSAIVLHADGLRRQLDADAPARERDGLEAIVRTGRDAMGEIRRVLGVLRRADDDADLVPARGFGDVRQLVHDLRLAGVAIDFEMDDTPTTVPTAIDLAGYRIAQECLTNAMRHAPGSRVTLQVTFAEQGVELLCENDVPRAPRGEPVGRLGSGSGLVGIRERVALLGGVVEVLAADDRHVVRARLPLHEGSLA